MILTNKPTKKKEGKKKLINIEMSETGKKTDEKQTLHANKQLIVA